MNREHEQLKEIAELIDYDIVRVWMPIEKIYLNVGSIGEDYYYGHNCILDAREIIFTPEFMRKINIYQYGHYDDYIKSVSDFNDIMLHLDNPVQYLYDTLKLGNK